MRLNMAMHFTFKIEGGDPKLGYLQGWDPNKIYYYNGEENEIAYINHPEELKYLREIFKETHRRELKHYVWNVNVPIFVRIFGVLRPWTGAGGMRQALDELKRRVKEYEDIYWDPKFFIPRMAIHIRKEPTRISESLGICKINEKYEVLESTTRCDWHWAKVRHNGVEGWMAMGDVTGEWYGEKLRA
nr:MAG TPA: hypothetical protein [Caudoviricetes sp.]